MSEMPGTRAGFVAVIGAPNAGKSTLINALVGGKISIVTHKVQTTRMRVRAVTIVGQSQLIFVDTPGIFAPRRRLDRAMVAAAWRGRRRPISSRCWWTPKPTSTALKAAASAHASNDTDAILARLNEGKRRAVLVLNKIDLVRPPELLALTAELNGKATFAETFMISATREKGVQDFADYCAAHVPEGPWLYPEDQMADLPLRQIAAEIVREKLMLRLHDELPYASTVETEAWQEKNDGSARIDATIYVERESQKMIVIGEKGRTIKEIGQAAREEISKLLGRPAHLFLFVKVRENWGGRSGSLPVARARFPQR